MFRSRARKTSKSNLHSVFRFTLQMCPQYQLRFRDSTDIALYEGKTSGDWKPRNGT